MTQTLFHYPRSPGFKRSGTSESAARSMRGRSGQLREKVLTALRNGEYTADEVAAQLGESVLSIRPRFSELLRMNRIEDTGLRRPNESGRNAVVWRSLIYSGGTR